MLYEHCNIRIGSSSIVRVIDKTPSSRYDYPTYRNNYTHRGHLGHVPSYVSTIKQGMFPSRATDGDGVDMATVSTIHPYRILYTEGSVRNSAFP